MENITELTYNEIRSKCKLYGLKANGKKTDLITRLTNYLKELTIGSDSQNNVETTKNKATYEVFLTDDEDENIVQKNLVSTFKKEEINDVPFLDNLKKRTPSKEVKVDKITLKTCNVKKSENNKVKFPLNTTVDYVSSDEEVFKDGNKKISTVKEESGRFTRQHKKIFNKAESIVERHERIKELHAKHEASVPETFKRLATPKRNSSVRRSTFLNGTSVGYDFSKASMDVSNCLHTLDRTPARNFDTSKIVSQDNGAKKFQERKKNMSLLQKLSCSFKKSGGNFSNLNTVEKKKYDYSDKKVKDSYLVSKKTNEDKVRKVAYIRGETALKREKQLNARR